MNNLVIPDIANIIESGKLDDEYNVIREIEETIIDLYEKNSQSELFQNELLLLIELNKLNKFNIKIYNDIIINELNLDNKIMNNLSNIVFTGPYLRSMFVENINTKDLKKEIFVNCINNLDYKTLIDESYKETNDMYYKHIEDTDYFIYIAKKTFRNPSEVILANYNLD